MRLGLLTSLAHVGGPVWNSLRNRGCGYTWECLLGREQVSVVQVVFASFIATFHAWNQVRKWTLIQPVIAQFVHSFQVLFDAVSLSSFSHPAHLLPTPLVPHFMIVSAPVRKERNSLLEPPLKCLHLIIVTLVSCKPKVVAELLNFMFKFEILS